MSGGDVPLRRSLWEDTAGPHPERRPPFDGPGEADVAIVGAGYTGLWTAYYLNRLQPDARIAVIEAEEVGFGASGRNGGWCTSEIAIDRDRAAAVAGRRAVENLLAAMRDTVDEIGRVAGTEGIDCDYAKGGTITFAANAAQAARLRSYVEGERAWGDPDIRWLGRADGDAIARSPGAVGAVYTPHCAAIHPLKLARDLAAAIEAKGVRIYEKTRATSIEPGRVVTDRGRLTAPVVLRCTEAFTAMLSGHRRDVVPLYSLMVATEPLPDDVWDKVGLQARPTFNDGRHLIIYGQRTADGRFAFGGRGAPYHFGSAISPAFDQRPSTHGAVAEALRSVFPQIGDAAITHTWGGAVAVPRDWTASIVYDPQSGMGHAGGYVGVGVAASNLAGRTLADLVAGRATDLTGLPWVGHRSPRWEPEPLRWLGINTGRLLAPAADRVEAVTGRPSRIVGGLLEWLTGHG